MPGQISASAAIETNPIPEVVCGFDQLWITAQPYDQLQVLRRDARHSYRTPRWSSDGKQIAFVDQTAGSSQIEILNTGIGQSTVMSAKFPYMRQAGFCSQISISSWSHSNRWLAFEYAYFGHFYPRLYYLDTTTGEAIPISEKAWGSGLSTWAPLVDRLAYVERDDISPGVQTGQFDVRVMDLSNGKPVFVELPLPDAIQALSGSSQPVQLITGLAWLSDDTLLVAFSPLDGDQPGQLYRVDWTSKKWQLLAEYRRDPTQDKADPSILAVSKNGQFVAWAGNALLILDTATWHEYARLHVSWLEATLLHWVQDSNGLPVLIYNTNREFWSYRPPTGATAPLIPNTVLSLNAGLYLQDADWTP